VGPVPIREDERRLEEPLVTELVSELEGWSSDGKRLEKTYTRKGFTDAVALVNAIAKAAEAADHHPDIHLESYKKVRIVLTTHASDGISRADIDLARTIDSLAARATA
jgi:4a-hydroxytetrahydrobiopterin dehydratase